MEDKGAVMTFEELKALGAPFSFAEVQVSLLKKTARLVMVVGQDPNPAKDFPLHDPNLNTLDDVAAHIIAAAEEVGLLDEDSKVGVVDLDGLAANAN